MNTGYAAVNGLNLGLTVFVVLSVVSLVFIAAGRWVSVWMGVRPRPAVPGNSA